MKFTKAFTLIELLIVVAIIAILAAIAVPNFLEAQTRSKVARISADMRTVATALESYAVDNNKYPWDEMHDNSPVFNINRLDGWFIEYQFLLTTPIAYLSSVDIQDPFLNPGEEIVPGQPGSSFRYYNYGYGGSGANWGESGMQATAMFPSLPAPGYILTSFGPDRRNDAAEWIGGGLEAVALGIVGVDRLYDATNGTISSGDITRTGGIPILGSTQD